MALSKSTTEIDAWAEIAAQGSRLGSAQDASDSYNATIHIDCALSNTTDHIGTEIIVQVGTDTSDAKDNWSDIARLIGPVGQAVSAALNSTEPAGETSLNILDPVTNNIDNNNKFKFIENTTPADSEIIYQSDNSGDAGDTITILDGLAHEQDATTSILYDVDNAAIEAVSSWSVELPPDTDRVRIIYNNNYDSGAATVFTRSRITKVTGI